MGVGVGVGRQMPKVNDPIVQDRRALGEDEGAELLLVGFDSKWCTHVEHAQTHVHTQRERKAAARVG